MYIKITLGALVSLTVAVAPIAAQFAATTVDISNAATPPNYHTINDAITNTDPGGTVTVAAGVYTESPASGVPLITIPASKTGLRLIGAQANVDPRPDAGTTRTVIDGTNESIIQGNGSTSPTHSLIRIEADDVEINGFTVRNEGSVDLIESLAGSDISDLAIRYCIVSEGGDEAIQIRDSLRTLIEYNYVHTTDGDGISVCCDSEQAVIQYNEIANIDTTNGAIYLYSPPSGSDGLQALIFRNLIRDVTVNTGIYMGINGGGDADTAAADIGGWIIENEFVDIDHDGIEVLHDGVLIQGNEFYGTFPNPSSGAYGMIAVREDVRDLTIVNNTIRDNTFINAVSGGIYLESGVTWSNFTISDNNFINNTPYAISNQTGALVTAENIWWNDVSGPDDDAMIINGSGDAISTDVDADPFAGAAFTIDTADGDIPEDPVVYGTQTINSDNDVDVSVDNNATLATLVVMSPGIEITGADADKFSVVTSPTFPLVLGPGASATDAFTIRYSPGGSAPLAHAATGTLTGSDNTAPTVSLSGDVVVPVALSSFSLD